MKNITEERIKEILTEHKFGEIEIVTQEVKYLRGISNSDVLPTFALGDNIKLVVTIYQHDGEKISNRKGFGWVHTNFQCTQAEKQHKKLAEANQKLDKIRAQRNCYVTGVVGGNPTEHQDDAYHQAESALAEYKLKQGGVNTGVYTFGRIPTPHDANYKKAEKAAKTAQKKLCNKHNAQYGCSEPCNKCLDFSKDRNVAKIQGSIFYRNGYGASSLEFVYFAIVKTNSEGVPMLYVRRRPASLDFLSMSAQDYQKNYVAKNKHIKNSFCICIYKPPEPVTTERKPDLMQVVQSEVAGGQNLPAVIGQMMPVSMEAKA